MQSTVPVAYQKENYRFVRYAFFKVEREWKRLPPQEREAAEKDFLSRLKSLDDDPVPHTYSTIGTRADADFMVWTITDSLEKLQSFHSGLIKSGLGKYLLTPYSFLAMFRPSEYFGKTSEPRRVGSKYLFVYPLTKKREWYGLPFAERGRIMKDHVTIGQKYSSVTIHTAYSFGLDDYEFVLAFETDYPQEFLQLVMELRSSEASKYTAVETPIFTCLSIGPEEMLDLLGPQRN